MLMPSFIRPFRPVLLVALAAVLGQVAASTQGVDPSTMDERTLLGYDSKANNITSGTSGKDVVYVPTPAATGYEMLRIANVGPEDTVYDLGSGDGRIVIMAAKHFGAKGVGIEFNPQLVELANRNARTAGVADKVTFLTQDIFQSDFSPATVITMFLLTNLNERLRPTLEKLRPGTRVVTNTFEIAGWEPVQRKALTGCSTWCNVLLFRVPSR